MLKNKYFSFFVWFWNAQTMSNKWQSWNLLYIFLSVLPFIICTKLSVAALLLVSTALFFMVYFWRWVDPNFTIANWTWTKFSGWTVKLNSHETKPEQNLNVFPNQLELFLSLKAWVAKYILFVCPFFVHCLSSR